ncbi:MAG: hypothetical protein DRI83_12245 [Bacteroidetes bacterium]|nr:MAG: hypothetical protein DRI83_12245 [Bacteroidota bacterium]
MRSQWAEIRIYDLRFGITSSRLIFNIRTYMRPLWGRDSIFYMLCYRYGIPLGSEFFDHPDIFKDIDAGGITCF